MQSQLTNLSRIKDPRTDSPCLASSLYLLENNTDKQRAAKPYKMAMNWAQVTQKKRQQVQIYVSKIYFYIYTFFLRFNNYIEFLIQIR